MGKKCRVFLALGAVLVLTLVLTCGPAMARYLESWAEDQGFWAKPLEPLNITQSWQQQDGVHTIRFTAGETAENCRVYLAATQGVTKPEQLRVTLTVRSAATQTNVTLTGVPEPIVAGSAMDGLFGPGTVYRFYDDAGQEVVGNLTAAANLTVHGLENGAEVTSLLRLFVENA